MEALRIVLRQMRDGAATELGNWFSHGSTHSLAVDGQTVFWTHSAGASSFVIRTSGVDGTSTTLADSSTIGSSASHISFMSGAAQAPANPTRHTDQTGAGPALLYWSDGTLYCAFAGNDDSHVWFQNYASMPASKA